MLRVRHGHHRLAVAPWIVAGAMLLGCHGAVTAHPALPGSTVIDIPSPEHSLGLNAGATIGYGEAMELSQVASADVDPGPDTAGGPGAWGALVGAAVAAIAALRGRFTRR